MRIPNNILVTGGSGFIGSAFIRYLFEETAFFGQIVNIDLLTYASSKESTEKYEHDPRYHFYQLDICNQQEIEKIAALHKIDCIVHFAAETHVDRSIDNPQNFLHTNILGTYALLEIIKKNPHIHFHHVSTDEVYGSLRDSGFFTETSAYLPNSPYAASKASSDHLVRSYYKTYGISMTMSHCTNNYGPFQHPEKLIPLMIDRCLKREKMPIYGTGKNVRDWLYVNDHVNAIWKIITKGKKGEVYDISGKEERTNIALIYQLIDILSKQTNVSKEKYLNLMEFVTDRLGHDYRYAIDSSKIQKKLQWQPTYSLQQGLEEAVKWYLQNTAWVDKKKDTHMAIK